MCLSILNNKIIENIVIVTFYLFISHKIDICECIRTEITIYSDKRQSDFFLQKY